MKVRIKQNIDWAAANELLHGLAYVLDQNDRGTLYEFVQGIKSDKTTKPEDLVEKVLEFLEQRVKHPTFVWEKGKKVIDGKLYPGVMIVNDVKRYQ